MNLEKNKSVRGFNFNSKFPYSPKNKRGLIFVIQKHAASYLHYDFRLAINGVLKSWAIPKGPCLDSNVKRLAMQVEDHPLKYATFEGVIPQGEYGAGTVMVWDYGVCIATEDLTKAYKKGHMKFELHGSKLAGTWYLIRTRTTSKNAHWLLFKAKDKFSKNLEKYDITKKHPNSVLTKCSLEEIEKQRLNDELGGVFYNNLATPSLSV